ncbi:MAG: SpoIIE family protein phosphatase [Anaerolineales bacterium]|nr:SpoIIE family protein phosphatase [Anaerolineales bacterium]
MSDQGRKIADDILIVDDTPANLRLLSQMLTELGYTVRAVTNGPHALTSAQTTPPNLILLDIRMPDMNGYEVCRRLKQEEKTRDIPVIFISSLNEIQDKVTGFSVGGVDYITKPFQFEEVLARIETHLSLRRLQKQLQDANKKFEQELMLAGSLQASFFPSEPPEIPGWQLSVKLKPARETSGDFYDVYMLPNDKLGIIIADVVDKGAAAALYMALSWTIIRNYSRDFPDQPERVLAAANRQIINDTDANRFVTVFYGVLDPSSGKLIYCNAGHNPPLILRGESAELERLAKTGMLLGMFEEEAWEQGVAQLDPGDLLLLYSDGVTEAQGTSGDFFDVDRMIESAKAHIDLTAKEIKEGILSDIYEFMGDIPQIDDIALVVVRREPE